MQGRQLNQSYFTYEPYPVRQLLSRCTRTHRPTHGVVRLLVELEEVSLAVGSPGQASDHRSLTRLPDADGEETRELGPLNRVLHALVLVGDRALRDDEHLQGAQLIAVGSSLGKKPCT